MKSLKKYSWLYHDKKKTTFYIKFYHAFILHEDKENQEELITKALSGIKSDKEAHKAWTESLNTWEMKK